MAASALLSDGTSRSPSLPDSTVLLVIDMQPGFAAANDEATISAVRQLIRLAKERRSPIVRVEFDPHERGETLAPLMEELRGYPHQALVKKSANDGSEEICKVCREKGFGLERFEACGVNSDACVIETVAGLDCFAPGCQVTVFQDACNSWRGKDLFIWTTDAELWGPNVILRLHGQQELLPHDKTAAQ